MNLEKLATVAATVSMGLLLLVQANPAAAQAAAATTLTCQQMSDTYGINHGKTWGTATAAIQDQWTKKVCSTSASPQAKPASTSPQANSWLTQAADKDADDRAADWAQLVAYQKAAADQFAAAAKAAGDQFAAAAKAAAARVVACEQPPAYRGDWAGCDLRAKILTNVQLPGANLSGANLSGANLSGANLTRAIGQGVWLNNANLTGANLIGSAINANLTGATLSGATWSGGHKCATPSIGVCMH